MSTTLTVEIMSSANAWVDVTADVKRASIQNVGLVAQRYAYPQTGKCVLTMNNLSKTYNPAQAIGIDTGVVDTRRRVRVRASGSSLGYKMQATLTGSASTTETDTTGTFSSVPTVAAAFWRAQRIVSSVTGIVKSIKSNMSIVSGTGTAIVQIRTVDGSGSPGVVLASTTYTNPAVGVIPEVTMPTGALTDNATGVFIVWGATGTLTYQLPTNAAGYTYNYKTSGDAGATWGSAATEPIHCGIVVFSDYGYFDQTVSNSSVTGNTFVLSWQGRAQFDSQVNTDYVDFITSAETAAVQTNTYTNKWKSYSYTFVTTANATTIKPRFYPSLAASVYGTTSGIEYKSFTLTKNGGSNLLTNGDLSSGAASPWAATSHGAITTTLAVASDYWVLFQGFVESIQPSMGLASDLQTVITCVDWVEILKLQNISTVLKESVTSDALITYGLSFLTPATFNATPPGTLLDAGTNTFDRVFDTNVQSVTSILEVMTNAAMSDFGRTFVDRDGTIRFINRYWLPLSQNTASKLTLAAGQGWGASQGQPSKDIDSIINSVVITYHPRLVGGSVQVLATATTAGAITIPGKKGDGTAGTATITLTYHDATGRVIGGKNQVNPLLAQTDIKVTDNPNGLGFDYTINANFSFTQTDAASQTTLVMSNTALGPLYASLLQVRGNPITIYDPIQIKVTDATSITAYQERTFTKDLLYGMDQQFATALAQYLVFNYKYPYIQFGGVKIANKDTFNGVDLLSLELFDYITISDTQTAITSMKHAIVGVNYELEPLANTVASVEFMLERVDYHNYCILNDATYGVLDSTNLLYI